LVPIANAGPARMKGNALSLPAIAPFAAANRAKPVFSAIFRAISGQMRLPKAISRSEL